MIELLGSIVGFTFDVVGMALGLLMDVFGFLFGLLGGLLSLLFSIAALGLGIGLICLIVHRRKKRRKARQPLVDENGEEFTSFYDQKQE